MKTHHILKVACADQKGLVYKITGVLYKNALNIIQNGEFVDSEKKLFFMRTEIAGNVEPGRLLKELKNRLPKDAVFHLDERRKKDIVIFATQEPHCLGDLLIRHAYGELCANIQAVVSNHGGLKSLAEKFEIPFHEISYLRKNQSAGEKEIAGILKKYNPEYLVLAKFMRVLSKEFVAGFRNRIINIHHSFLPAFAGSNPYRQACDRGVKIIGATAHFVTDELDKGPIIAQAVVPVDHSHSVSDMAQAGRDVEKIVLAKALKLAFEDRIFVSGNKTILFD